MMRLFERPSVPGSSRGILPLLAAAAGGIRAAYGMYEGNQRKQKNKGYINAAYDSAKLKLDNRQGDIEQSTAESLNARGLAQGGGSMSAVRAAMVNGKPVSQGPAPTTLGGQTMTDLGKEFSSEQEDLSQQKTKALNDNKADYQNTVIDSIGKGIQTASTVYNAGQDLSALKSAGAAGAPSATRQAYQTGMTGIDDPANVFGGIHPVDPLGAPGSSWNKGTTFGAGQPNFAFNSGNG